MKNNPNWVSKGVFWVITPRNNSEITRCQWCGGDFTDRNRKQELISQADGTDFGMSTGIMCTDCYTLMITLPKDYWVANTIWSKKMRAAADERDDEQWEKLYEKPPRGLKRV
jgi:hypothetical protein